MEKVTLIFPFVGTLNKYHVFSLNQISNVEKFKINLIIDRNNLSNLSDLNKKVKVTFIEDVFLEKNNLGIKLNDILLYPYKLCDYRPFFDYIFNFDFCNFWGFGDLDCIYNSKVLSSLSNDIKDTNSIYGDRGHLTIFGIDALKLLQNDLIEQLRIFNDKGINLLNANKGYAIDEHRFLHVICERLDKEMEIKWDKNFFKPYFDVDYKNIRPKNLDLSKYSFDLFKIYKDGDESNLSYIHLQKRKIESDKNIYNSLNLLSFSPITGNAIYAEDYDMDEGEIKTKNKVRFYCTVLFKRFKYRIFNYGVNKRPSL